jgi:hypothetical protein
MFFVGGFEKLAQEVVICAMSLRWYDLSVCMEHFGSYRSDFHDI